MNMVLSLELEIEKFHLLPWKKVDLFCIKNLHVAHVICRHVGNSIKIGFEFQIVLGLKNACGILVCSQFVY